MTLVGSGSQEGALRRLARELRLEHVRFAGRVPPDEIWRYYADADIYLQTPDIDNMPLSVLEAFASGTPVVSTRVGGVPAILEDGVHGLLAPAGNARSVADQMLRLLREPGLASRLAEAARESCDRYRWPTVRAQWLALYRELVEAGAPAGAEVRTA